MFAHKIFKFKNKMFGKIVLLGAGVIVCLVQANNLKECGKIFHPRSQRCCKTFGVKLNLGDDIKECIQEGKTVSLHSENPESCDLEKCLAEKRGILKADGTVDKDNLKKEIQTEFSALPALAEKATEECVEKDVSKYAPSDFCELIKIRNCIGIQAYSECTEWDNADADCKDIKELIEKCTS